MEPKYLNFPMVLREEGQSRGTAKPLRSLARPGLNQGLYNPLAEHNE